MNLEEAVDASKKYLESDSALKSIKRDPYWPKWNSPLWHMLALWEIKKAHEIPRSTVEVLVDKISQYNLRLFPTKMDEVPPGTNVYRQIPCHCQLGNTYQLLSACEIDVDDKIPWLRPWFLKYQLSDGGLNCDEAHYARENGKSSVVSTLPCLEALLRSAKSLTQAEIEYLDRGADYLIKHRLTKRTHTEELMHPRFAEFIFPRFYEYDILRGLSFLTDWASFRKKTIPSEIIEEAFQCIENRITNDGIGPTRSFGMNDQSYNENEENMWSWQSASTFPLLEELNGSAFSSKLLMNEFLRIKSVLSETKRETEKNRFELQPTLNGNSVKLVPLKPEDFESLYGAASDPLIWELHPQPTRYQRSVFKSFFEGAISSGGAFLVIDTTTNDIIGSSRYYDLKPDESQIKIGYTFLSRSHWGGKYNQDMKNLMLKHAFQFVDRVIFEIGEMNLRSRRAIEKIGAHLISKQTLDGKSHVVYHIDRTEFKN